MRRLTVPLVLLGCALLALTFAIAGPSANRTDASAIAAPASPAASVRIELVAPGSIWKYRDTGENLGAAWMATGFDDSAWMSGPAPLGYNDPVSTTVGFGGNSGNKYITTYFRRAFTVESPGAYSAVSLGLRRDDGGVVYINGVEVHRSNMPTGVITYQTLAASTVGEDYNFHTAGISATALLTGANALAVEIHQSGPGSSDIGFDLSLGATAPEPPEPARAGVVRFAAIGDYGFDGQPEADVAALVRSWNPDFIITAGDNNYDAGSASTIDANIGKHYHDFIAPYTGAYGAGSVDGNRFWPATGNHDWYSTPPLQPYLDYFSLPGNERFYDLRRGPVHFFFLDSEDMATRGALTTTQSVWLQNGLSASSARWKIVVMHHPAYSSGNHGSVPLMRWPFEAWGATAVIQGHDHHYERLAIGGIPYFVDGLGGRSIYPIPGNLPGSQVRYNGDYGAMKVEANDCAIVYRFYSRTGLLIDTFAQTTPCGRPVTRFAVLGDFGAAASGNPEYVNGETAVAALISDTLRPDFILTVGDNNYGTRPPRGTPPDTRGSAGYIDANIGQFYHAFLAPYTGAYGAGAENGNRFFPALGNADWFQPFPTSTVAPTVTLAAHFGYFPWLEERLYYSFTAPTAPGVVDIFVASVDSRDPDRLQLAGAHRTWFQTGLASSKAAWQIGVVHYPPFVSENVTNTTSYSGAVNLRLDFAGWGADAVLSGDSHLYERVMAGITRPIPYFVNGAGGAGLASFGAAVTPVPGSAARYDLNFGAQLVEASPCHLQFKFIAVDGQVIDTWTELRECPPLANRAAFLPLLLR